MLGCAPWEPIESSPTSLMATRDGLDWAEWEVSLPPQGHICVLHFTHCYSSHPCPRQCRGLPHGCSSKAAAVLLVQCSPSQPAFTSRTRAHLAIPLCFCSPSLCNPFRSSATGEAKTEQSAEPSRSWSVSNRLPSFIVRPYPLAKIIHSTGSDPYSFISRKLKANTSCLSYWRL